MCVKIGLIQEKVYPESMTRAGSGERQVLTAINAPPKIFS